jgi:hypothetical protein
VRLCLCVRQCAVDFAWDQASRIAVIIDADHKITSSHHPLDFEILATYAVRFKPVDFGFADRIVRKSHGCDALHFAPTAPAVSAVQIASDVQTPARCDRPNICNLAEYLKCCIVIHRSRSQTSAGRARHSRFRRADCSSAIVHPLPCLRRVASAPYDTVGLV